MIESKINYKFNGLNEKRWAISCPVFIDNVRVQEVRFPV